MLFRVKAAALLLFALFPFTVHAQSQARVVTTCGTMIGPNYIQGSTSVLTMDPTGVLCTSAAGGGGGGLSVTDQAAFTQGVSQFTPNGGVFNDTATLSSGQQGTQRYTTKRAGIIDVDTTGNTLYSAITAPAPALAATTSTTNSYSNGATVPLNADLNGNLYTNTKVTGNVAITAASLPLPTGAATSANQGLSYPVGATPITASATGTTGATTATLAANASLKTYLCSYSIRANATAATTVTNTITGVVTATLSHIMWVAPAASGLGVDEQIFNPCVPSSAINTAIAVVSGAPGSGGNVSATATGYQAP